MSSQKIILIAGPTASGKSALALEKACEQHGTIINADAMQIYNGLPILTNQPGVEEQKQIPHELFAVLDPAERSSAGVWRALAVKAIEKTIATGRTPILIGGTGLYFKALFGGLDDMPAIPEATRAQAKKLYDEIGEEKFRAELSKCDPASASRIARNDRQRLIRAYEVVAHTGRPLSAWQKKHSGVSIQHSGKQNFQLALPECRMLNAECYLILPDRAALYAACDARFAAMIARGALEEVRQFLTRDLDSALPAMKTIGVRELAAHIHGKITLDQAIAKAQQATRNYAKRQMTWFRNQWQHSRL